MKKLIIEIIWGMLLFAFGYYGGWISCQPEPPYPSDSKTLDYFSGRSRFHWSGAPK